MKKIRNIATLWLFLGIFLQYNPSWAQLKLSEKPEEFIVNVQTMLSSTNQPRQMQISEALGQAWNGLGDNQKQLIIKTSRQMLVKKCTALGGFSDYYQAIVEAHEEGDSQIDNFLEATLKTVNQYDLSKINNFLHCFQSFFFDRAIYHSNQTRVYVLNGTYSVDFYDEAPIDTSYTEQIVKYTQKGGLIKFFNADVYLVSAVDSVLLKGTSGIYTINDMILEGKGGRFDWANIYLIERFKDAEGKPQIVYFKEYANMSEGNIAVDLQRYVIEAAKPSIRGVEASLQNNNFLQGRVIGKFDYLGVKRQVTYDYEYYLDEKQTKHRRVKDTIRNADYPRFSSTETITLDNLGERVFYKGGFTQQGVLGYGSAIEGYGYATFEGIRPDGSPLFKVKGKKFEFSDTTVISKSTKYSIYVGNNPDSISHQSVDFWYNNKNQLMQLIRNTKTGAYNAPFIDNNHKLYMDVDMLQFDMKNDSLDFYMLTLTDSLLPVSFESFNFFDAERYSSLLGINDFHPVKLFDSYAKLHFNNYGVKTFTLNDIAQHYKKDMATMRVVAHQLSEYGYIDYDEITGYVTPLHRLGHEVKADEYARVANTVNRKNIVDTLSNGKFGYNQDLKFGNEYERGTYNSHDYDNMRILAYSFNKRDLRQKAIKDSTAKKELIFAKNLPQASMKLGTDPQLLIRGVDRFTVSDSLRVYFRPALEDSIRSVWVYAGDQSIFMPQGELIIGDVRYVGENFFMNYADFEVSMGHVEHIYFKYKDSTGKVVEQNGVPYEYGGEVQYNPGASTIIINTPNNRSGLKQGTIEASDGLMAANDPQKYLDRKYYATFPTLDIEYGGYVKFDNPQRRGEAYDSSRIMFVMPEIRLDSLGLKTPTFPGVFQSNIFPPFNETLVPMEDLSMGFEHTPPPEGYAIFPDQPVVEEYLKAGNLTIVDPLKYSVDSVLRIYPPIGTVQNAHMDFTGKIVFNQNGLFAPGQISYLSTKLNSTDKFLFMPDSVLAEKTLFQIDRADNIGIKQASFPQAKGKRAKLDWFIPRDSMLLSNDYYTIPLLSQVIGDPTEDAKVEKEYVGELFELYGDDGVDNLPIMTVDGTLIVQANGLLGAGLAYRKDFDMSALGGGFFKFDTDTVGCQQAQIQIYSKERDPYKTFSGTQQGYYNDTPPVLSGFGMNFDYDIASGKANIKPFSEELNIGFDLPYAFFQTTIGEAIWDSNQKTIEMHGDSTSLFKSTKFSQGAFDERDLRFNGTDAFYDIAKLRMVVEGIPDIHSADSKIVPDSGRAVVLREAELELLKNAKVISDTLNQYHTLTKGTIKILSRLEFEGDATYQFINPDDSVYDVKFDRFVFLNPSELAIDQEDFRKSINQQMVVQEVVSKNNKNNKNKGKDTTNTNFNTVSTKTEGTREITKGQGYVDSTAAIYYTTNILYYGDMIMYANKPGLALKGYIRADLQTGSFKNWIPFNREAGDIAIGFPEKLADPSSGHVIASGVHFGGETGLYSTFLSPLNYENDKSIFLASGEFNTNSDTREFKIIPREKKIGQRMTGNVLIYNDKDGSMSTQGKLNLVDSLSQKYIFSAGEIHVKPSENTFVLNTLLLFDLPISANASARLTENLSTNFRDSLVSVTRSGKDSLLALRIAELVGDKEALKYFSVTDKISSPVISMTYLMKPFVFSDVNLSWSPDNAAFYSQGPLRLMNASNKTYGREVVGQFELRKNPAGDAWSLYFEAGNDWYFVNFENNVMSLVSSNSGFNDEIAGKVIKGKKEGDFSLTLGESSQKEAFISNFAYKYGGQ